MYQLLTRTSKKKTKKHAEPFLCDIKSSQNQHVKHAGASHRMRQTDWDILKHCLVFCHEGWLWSWGWSEDVWRGTESCESKWKNTNMRLIGERYLFSFSTWAHKSIHELVQGAHGRPLLCSHSAAKSSLLCVFKSPVSSSCGSAAGEQMISDNAARSAHLDRLFLSPCQISGLICQIRASKWEFLTATQRQEGRRVYIQRISNRELIHSRGKLIDEMIDSQLSGRSFLAKFRFPNMKIWHFSFDLYDVGLNISGFWTVG